MGLSHVTICQIALWQRVIRPLSRLFSGTTQAGYVSATLKIIVEQQNCAPVRFVYMSNVDYTDLEE